MSIGRSLVLLGASASLGFGILASLPARAAAESAASAAANIQVAVIACASGYHLNAAGDCEPRQHRPSLCRKGYEAESFPNGNGYKCVRIPRGY
jgi:hypothetical protein